MKNAARALLPLVLPLALAHAAPASDVRFAATVSYLGGEGKESARDTAMDREGNVYLTGGTETRDFPVTEGAFDTTHNGWQDVWVAKLTAAGELAWCTFLGGPGYDRAYAIEVGADGAVTVAGRAGEGFPTTKGALQREFGGDRNPSKTYGKQDGFVARLSAGGDLQWATYVGIDDGANFRDLDVDPSGAVYALAGVDKDFPSPYVTRGAYQTRVRGERDALLLKLAPDGSRVVYGTYLGGSHDDGGAGSVRVDDDGRAWVLGHTRSDDLETTKGAYQRKYAGEKDLFLARLSPDGSRLELLTYFGGSAADNTETHGLVLAPDGGAYIAATTLSPDLPAAGAAKARAFQAKFGGAGTSRARGKRTNYPGDAFLARFSGDGTELLGFTYFGGPFGEGLEGCAVAADGSVWVSGGLHSRNLTPSETALQRRFAGKIDAFVACFEPDLSSCRWWTMLGGSDVDVARSIAVSPTGAVAAAGVTYSPDVPVTGRVLDRTYGAESDILVIRLEPERP